MLVKGKILEWGNSFGLRLNKAEVIGAGLSPDEEVVVEVKRRISTGRDMFGTLGKKVDTDKALREIDELFREKKRR
jgi:antitoxin component of MazEF toxin-antitoxin module